MMERSDVLAALHSAVPEAEITLEGADCNFTVTLVSPHFRNMKMLARQQLAMSGLLEPLKTGEIHAISIRAWTPEEWRAQNAPVIPVL